MDARSDKKENGNVPSAKFALFEDYRCYAPKVRTHDALTFISDTMVSAIKPGKKSEAIESGARKRRQGRTKRKAATIEKAPKSAVETNKEYTFRIIYGNDGEIESYSAAICKFLAGSEYAASANAYHDANGYIGIAYKTMSNFKSNHEQPFLIEDTRIDCMHKQELRLKLIGTARNLLDAINKKESAGFFSGFFCGGSAKELAAVNMQLNFIIDNFDAVMSETNRMKAESVFNKYIGTLKSQNKNCEEITLLNKILDAIQSYILLPQDHKEINIETIEAALVVARKKEIDLDSLNDDDQVKLFVNHRNIHFKASDLKNYVKIKGLAIAFTTQYLQHGEMNNTSFSNEGRIMDFGMTNFDIHFMRCDISQGDMLLRSHYHDTLRFTERDIRRLPVLTDTQPYYWPTLETRVPPELTQAFSTYLRRRNGEENAVAAKLNQMTMHLAVKPLTWLETAFPGKSPPVNTELGYIKIIDGLFDEESAEIEQEITECSILLENSRAPNERHFSAECRDAFRELEHHPVFVFFKFKTILKYLLTDRQFHLRLAELYISNGKRGNNPLPSEQIADIQESRTAALKKILFKMPEFNNYIAQHREYALAIIQHELGLFAMRQQKKFERHPDIPHYERLAKAIDPDKMTAHFNTLCQKHSHKL